MELKSDFWLGNLPPETSFNRTFMELKYMANAGIPLSHLAF